MDSLIWIIALLCIGIAIGVPSWLIIQATERPFFAFPPAVRRVIYTTNAIESINARLRKIIRTRGHFPSDDAAAKLIWLGPAQHHGRLGSRGEQLEGGHESIRHPLR